MTPELPSKPATPEEDLPPLGMRIAIVFLRVIGFVLYLSLFGSALAAAMMTPEPFPMVVAPFGIFLVLLMMKLGCDWMVHHLRTSTMGSPWSTRFQRPLHPIRHIFLPPILGVMGYAVIAVLSWLPSLARTPFSETWAWPVAWCVIGFGAMYLCSVLDEKLP